MKEATALLCTEDTSALSSSPSRALDFLTLTKPRVAVLVLFTVAAGGLIAGGSAADSWILFHGVFGTALVAGGACALNQLLERRRDGQMNRTANRPLPAGRLQPAEVLIFGLTLGIGGVLYLALTLQQFWTPLLAAITLILYVCAYTPLKTKTSFNTLIGAVPGALPPVIGWSAVRGELDWSAGCLFLIVFTWQIPHFLAIAWIYREDYARAGMKMLPVNDPTGKLTGRVMVLFSTLLLPIALLPILSSDVGLFYVLGSLLFGLTFLINTLRFLWDKSTEQARRALLASLVYLPGLLALLLLDDLVRNPL